MSALPMTQVVTNDVAFTAARLIQEAKSCVKGELTGKGASDYLELAVNKYIIQSDWSPCVPLGQAVKNCGEIQSLVERLPTQTKRDDESEAYQQFSTPPQLAYVAAWAANLSANDTLLEPSAGIGGLLCWAVGRVRHIWANELSVRRAAMLRALLGTDVLQENAEQLDNVLDDSIKPSVILMNPPFSATAGRVEKMVTSTGATHVEQALLRLMSGGRLVTILGRGMAPDAARFTNWWSGIRKQYTVRANIGIEGREYRKYGTNFGTRLIVIDKLGPTKVAPLTLDVDNLAQAIGVLSNVRNQRQAISSPIEPSKLLEIHGAPVKGPCDNAGAERVSAASVFADDGGRISKVHARRDIPSSEPVKARGPAVAVEYEVIEAASTEFTAALYEAYSPQRIKIRGAQPHPTPLVQSAAMAGVVPPIPTYKPLLDPKIIESGALSDAQLEAVIYAGHAFSQWLEPVGEEKVSHRRGIFVGDAPGVGKGRAVSAVIMDAFNQGETKAIWVSKNGKLILDAKRDWTDIGGNPNDFIELRKIKESDPIPDKSGILFVTYGLLRRGADYDKPPKFPRISAADLIKLELDSYQQSKIIQFCNKPNERNWNRVSRVWIGDKYFNDAIQELDPSTDYRHASEDNIPEKELIWRALGLALPTKEANGVSRLEQIIKWCGPDFSGVICFDESHEAKNSMGDDVKGW